MIPTIKPRIVAAIQPVKETNNVFKSLDPTLTYTYQFHYAHPYIFSTKSLARILGQAGFKPVDIKNERYLKCLARVDLEQSISAEKEHYRSVIKHIKKHDKYLWFTNLVFYLRVFLARIRGRG